MYDLHDRGKVTARLRKVADQLRKTKKMDVRKLSIIARARIPIIKVGGVGVRGWQRGDGCTHSACDIFLSLCYYAATQYIFRHILRAIE